MGLRTSQQGTQVLRGHAEQDRQSILRLPATNFKRFDNRQSVAEISLRLRSVKLAIDGLRIEASLGDASTFCLKHGIFTRHFQTLLDRSQFDISCCNFSNEDDQGVIIALD